MPNPMPYNEHEAPLVPERFESHEHFVKVANTHAAYWRDVVTHAKMQEAEGGPEARQVIGKMYAAHRQIGEVALAQNIDPSGIEHMRVIKETSLTPNWDFINGGYKPKQFDTLKYKQEVSSRVGEKRKPSKSGGPVKRRRMH